jgi:hypothetical protein
VFLSGLTFLLDRLHREKKGNCPKSKFIMICPRRESTERRKTKKNMFCVLMQTDFLLGYVTQRKEKIRIIWKIS